jgi:hypothetical protein
MMARICFPPDVDTQAAIAKRDYGYSVLTHVSDSEPDHLFVEASRAAESADSELLTVAKLVDPFHGFVSDAGPMPHGHVPFEYD